MRDNALISVCDAALEGFCRDIEAFELKKEKIKKRTVWKIDGKLSKIEIVYIKKGTVLNAPSLLYARLFPNKNDYFFLLPHEVFYLREPSQLNPFVYPFIESETRMLSCIKELLSHIKELLPQLAEIAMDEEKFKALKEAKNKEIYRIFNIAEKDIPSPSEEYFDTYFSHIYSLYENNVVIPRLTSQNSPFLLLASGKLEKAKAIYLKWNKKNSLSEYELLLLEKLLSEEPDFEIYSPECDSISEVSSFASPSAEGLHLLLNTLFCFLVFSVLFIGIISALTAIKSAGTVFYAATPFYFGFILGGLPAIFGGLALRRALIPILYRKNKEAMLSCDKMINSKAVSVFAYVIFAIIFIITLFFSLVASLDGISFYSDRLQYNKLEAFPIYSQVNIPYTEIENVYKIEGRYNDYDEYIPRSSYVISFKNGTQLDLDGYISPKTTEEKLLPIIDAFTDEPITLKSDRELPKK